MYTISPEELAPKEWGKLIKGVIVPRPIAWITTINEQQVVNAAPFSYFNVLTPTILAVSIQYDPNQRKDTAGNLIAQQEAVVHIPDRGLLAQMDHTSAPLSAEESELDLADLHTIESDLVQPPGIKEAKVRLETRLEKHLPLTLPDSDEPETELFLLRIVKAHVASEVYDPGSGYVNTKALDPVARLGGPNYSAINQIEDFQRHF